MKRTETEPQKQLKSRARALAKLGKIPMAQRVAFLAGFSKGWQARTRLADKQRKTK